MNNEKEIRKRLDYMIECELTEIECLSARIEKYTNYESQSECKYEMWERFIQVKSYIWIKYGILEAEIIKEVR